MARPELLAAIGAAREELRLAATSARRSRREHGYVGNETAHRLTTAKENLAEAIAAAEKEDTGVKTWAVAAGARPPTKPTRAQLLRVIYQLQSLVGQASAAYDNDRGVDRAGAVQKPLKTAFDLCVATTQFDPPQRSNAS